MRHEAIFLGLKQTLSAIADRVPPGARAILVDYPMHGNVGDLLIHLAEERFFAAHGIEVAAQFTFVDYCRPSWLKPNDVFFFHGGGNCGDLYPEHRLLLEQIVQENPHHHIVVFPQTVHFVNRATYLESCRILRTHPLLTFYARDRSSYDLLIAGGLLSVYLMPDMAHQLYGGLGRQHPPRRSEPNVILRIDRESRNGPYTALFPAIHALDWIGGISRSNKWMARLWHRLLKAYGARLLHPVTRALWRQLRKRIVADAKRYILAAPATSTDRLHVMILCGLLGRPVNVYDNSYGKLSSYYDTWLAGDPLITFQNFQPLETAGNVTLEDSGGMSVCELPS